MRITWVSARGFILMTTREICKGNCRYCGYLCAFDVVVEDGAVVDITPDTSRYPYDEHVVSRCQRWCHNLEELDGRYRINRPLRARRIRDDEELLGVSARAGDTASGRDDTTPHFEEISWECALSEISQKLMELKSAYGPQTLASAIAGPHTSYWPLHKFMSLFGSPNNMGIGQICWNPRVWVDALTFGWSLEPALSSDTKAIILWATNPAVSDNSLFWAQIRQMREAGVKLIVIDPRTTWTAHTASLHLAPYPGTDRYLALGLLNVIVTEGLYNEDFVQKYCIGFDEIKAEVIKYTPDAVSARTGVSERDIIRAARIWADSGAGVCMSGRGIDQLGPETLPTLRAIALLRAVMGYIDTPGTTCLQDMSLYTPEVVLERSDVIRETGARYDLNADILSLQSYLGYERIERVHRSHQRALPFRYLTSAHPERVLNAMLYHTPYPITALIVAGANPVSTFANTSKVIRALKALKLLVVLEEYLTPTACLADYVLPVAGAFETETCQMHGGVANYAYGGPRAIEPLYERKSDYDIMRALGCACGQADEWPDESFHEALDRVFEDAGCDFDAFAHAGVFAPAPQFYKYRTCDEITQKSWSFPTSTGKIEFVPHILDRLGYGSLTPSRRLIPPRASIKQGSVLLMTGARKPATWASSYMHFPDVRRRMPYPTVSMTEQTAHDLGLIPDSWVWLSNRNGECILRLTIEDMPYGCASADYGWWVPEVAPGTNLTQSEAKKLLHIATLANINNLTTQKIEESDQVIGTWSYNALVVQIRAATPVEYAQIDDICACFDSNRNDSHTKLYVSN